MNCGSDAFTVIWKSARRAETSERPDIAMQRYLLAASLAPTTTEEHIALVSAWICHERMFRRPSQLEVGEALMPPRRAPDGHLGAIGE